MGTSRQQSRVLTEQAHAAPAKRPRSAAVDAVRVLGIVAIVVGHTWPGSTEIRRVIGLWQVPAFFLLAGYLWSGSRGWLDDLRHRARALLRPYAFWLVVIGVPFLLVALSQGENVVRLGAALVRGQQLGRPFSAFWFVVALFLTGVAVRSSQALPRAVVWALAVLGAVATTLWGPAMAATPFSVGMVPVAVLLALVGQELRARRSLVRRTLLVGAVLLALWVLAVVLGVAPLDLKYGVIGTPVLSLLVAVVVSVGLVLVAEALVPRLPVGAQVAVTSLASVGIVVLLLHAALLWVTDDLLGLPLVVCFVAALVVPWALGFLLARTPLAPWTLGRRPG
jgi:acyltransferase